MIMTIDTEKDFDEVAMQLSLISESDHFTFIAIKHILTQIGQARSGKTKVVCQSCGSYFETGVV